MRSLSYSTEVMNSSAVGSSWLGCRSPSVELLFGSSWRGSEQTKEGWSERGDTTARWVTAAVGPA